MNVYMYLCVRYICIMYLFFDIVYFMILYNVGTASFAELLFDILKLFFYSTLIYELVYTW